MQIDPNDPRVIELATPTQLEHLKAVHKHGGIVAAEVALGLGRDVIGKAMRRLQAKLEDDVREGAPVAASLPPKDLPFSDRLATMKARNTIRITHARAQEWQKVFIPVDGPYALCWFGDPHLDDPYCDLEALERHGRLCAATEGMYGINGGDSVNNWVGRLVALYAEQSATASEGWELVDWFLNGLGIRWAAWLLGNHDKWNEGSRIFERMNTLGVLMRDWEAKLALVSPDGAECRVWARHDFKGSSIYNELHGQKRAAMFSGGAADIYAAFHRHTFGTSQHELDNGRDATLIRARGYKEVDGYAIVNGFAEQKTGQSVVTVVEPRGTEQPKVTAFRDVEDGADFLRFKRSKL